MVVEVSAVRCIKIGESVETRFRAFLSVAVVIGVRVNATLLHAPMAIARPCIPHRITVSLDGFTHNANREDSP